MIYAIAGVCFMTSYAKTLAVDHGSVVCVCIHMYTHIYIYTVMQNLDHYQ